MSIESVQIKLLGLACADAAVDKPHIEEDRHAIKVHDTWNEATSAQNLDCPYF